VIVLLLTIMTAYELLWAMATEDHAELQAQYRLVPDIDPAGTTVATADNKHYVRGDFDGDREADYALVVARVGSEGYCVLALLTRGRGSKVVKVSCGGQGRPGAVTLALLKGSRPRRDTLIVTPADAPSLRFEWRSASEGFYAIQR
jgi:hypothetical protein